METLESSRVCRLCGKHSGISIDIFDRNESHHQKINAVLPIMVHEMDLLPKHMCHRCSYKLEEFHKFYEDCLRTDAHLKSKLSWMRKGEATERIGVPMVHIQDLKIKLEPPDFHTFDTQPLVDNVNYLDPMSFPVNGVQQNGVSYTTYPRCKYCCDKVDQTKRAACAGYHKAVPVTSKRDTGKRKPSSSNDLTKIKRDPLEDETPRSSVVVLRNLRPRRRSVDYVGTKRKSTPKIAHQLLPVTKIELPDIKIEGRILRPRRNINYQEPKNRPLIKRERPEKSSSMQRRTHFRLLDKLKLRGNSVKKKLGSSKLDLARKAAADYTPKFLRSQDIYLRNGKTRIIKEEPCR